MELSVTHCQSHVLATCLGAIDDTSGKLFDQHLYPLLMEEGAVLLVDLAGCDRINSLGISHLMRLFHRAKAHSSRIIFVAPTPFVANVFYETRLTTLFDIDESLSAPISRLG